MKSKSTSDQETLDRLGKMLRLQRENSGFSVVGLAKQAKVSVKTVNKIESNQIGAVKLGDIIKVAAVLGLHGCIQLVPIKPVLPSTNQEILGYFDRLLKGKDSAPFTMNAPDNEFPGLDWSVVGDVKRNLLFVVGANKAKNVRIGKITDDPGGWSISGQEFGIDVETSYIADQMCQAILAEHGTELGINASQDRSKPNG